MICYEPQLAYEEKWYVEQQNFKNQDVKNIAVSSKKPNSS